MRKALSAILAVFLLFIPFAGAAGAAEPPGANAELRFFVGQTVYLVNGETKYMDAAPIIRESRTLLPIRFAAEPLGAAVAWDGAERKVTVTLGDKVVNLWIGNPEAFVGGSPVPIDPENSRVRPLIHQNRTMLPLRFVAESLGAEVQWNPADRSVRVARRAGGGPPAKEPREAPAAEEPKPPVIANFAANPGRILLGGSSTLSWQVLNATAVTLNGEAVSATGSKTVSPSTTTYTLRAAGAAGETAEATETVTVTEMRPGGIRIILPPGGLPISVPEGAAEEEPEPAPQTGDLISALPRVVSRTFPLPVSQPVYVKIMLDSLYCMEESDWDHLTDSDEPYLVVTGFASGPERRAWSAGIVGPFGDVDSEENRRIEEGRGRLVFEGEVAPGSAIGFNVMAWEADACSGDARRQIADGVAAGIEAGLGQLTESLGLPDVLHGIISGAVGDVLGRLFSQLYCLLGGGADDLVANETVALGYEDLQAWARDDPHRPMVLDLDGGGSGHYHLRWHLEFDRQASRSFGTKFTNYDDFAVGDLIPGPIGYGKEEVLVVIDEDAPGDNGRFYIYAGTGDRYGFFDAFYTRHDRVAVGDVLGDGSGEVIVASNDDGGKIAIYDRQGLQQRNFHARFTKYDGLAVGNVLGDAKAEILVACDEDKKVYVYDGNGRKAGEFGINWDFRGCRYLGEDTRHDAFLVGDVLGDGYAEVVMVENQNGGSSKVHVYDANGRELRAPFEVFFTHFDAAALGDLKGDAKKELLIATDDGDGAKGYAVRLYAIGSGSQVSVRYWPCFTKYDGFAAGDALGAGRDQVLLATDEDDRVYLSK